MTAATVASPIVRAAGRFDRWLFAPMPARRVAALRVLVCLYVLGWLLARLPYLLDLAELPDRRFAPVGVLAPLDGAPARSAVIGAWAVAALATGALLLGWRTRIVGPISAVTVLVVTTYANSWSQVFHTENLAVLHLAVLALAPCAAAWSLDARGRPVPDDDERFGWPVRCLAIVTVASYVVAGWAKLDIGGFEWLSGDVLRTQVAFDNLRKILLGDVHSPLGGWFVRHDVLFGVFALATLVIELGAPLALLVPRLRTPWVIGAWGFHVGIVALMAIVFPYQLLGIAYAPLFAVERPAEAVLRDRHRRSSALE